MEHINKEAGVFGGYYVMEDNQWLKDVQNYSTMPNTTKILRLHYERGLGINGISRSISLLSTSTVSDCAGQALTSRGDSD